MPLLKSLELHGYKTFASRTIFEFPGMVTAIVGPNGSGKSNIADALRWVLGEQSYSLLRGRKTEDMIFSGSELRPRAGMASATITFDNEDSWLPIDYSEVSITRRAYRDGTNEYLLNGQRVRLKEIAELLAQSGLAERTYTIIGQGLVDAALSLKPEERRRFFEEAAGIGLYRARREESVHRLESTRRNLERVTDILSELEPRVKSLERQAKRAAEYDQLRADLRALLRDWYGYHWHRSQTELVRYREVLRVMDERLAAERDKQTAAETGLNEVRGRVQEIRTQLNEWHHQSAELHTLREQVNRRLAVMDERQRALAGQQQSAESDLARLEEEQKAHLERLNELKAERERLQTELEEASERAAGAQADLQARQAERRALEDKLREARRQQVSAETKQVQVKARADELANRLESQRASQRSLEQAAVRDKEDLERAQARLATWEKNRKQAEEEAQAAEEALRAHRQAIQGLEEQRRQAQSARGQAETELSRATAQLDVLQQAERSLSGLTVGAKYILEEAQKGHLKGAYRAFSSALVVPTEYEQAVAAALGEYLDSVVLEDEDSLEAALTALAGEEKGRAVLVPLSDDYPDDGLPRLKDEDCLGVAADLVQCTPDLQPALKLLLGHALIVRDRKAARRLSRQIPRWAMAVTLEGEVYLGNGAVVAGRERKAANVIGRGRRVQELQADLAGLTGRVEGASRALKDLESKLQETQTKARSLEGELRQKQTDLSKANQGYQQASLETERILQRKEYQARQAAGVAEQLGKTEAEIKQAQAESETAQARASEFTEQVRELNRQLTVLPLEDLQRELAHWNTSQAVNGRAVREADRRLEEQAESEAVNQRRRETLKKRLDEATAGLSELEGERGQAQAEESKLNDAIAELRKQIDPAEVQLAQVEKEAARAQDDLFAAQSAATAAERRQAQAQLDMLRSREQVDSLRRKVEEDFGLVAFEYNPEVQGPTPLPFEGLVEQLPKVLELPRDLDENIARQRALLRRMGPINPEVQTEYKSVRERFEYLTGQVSDLHKADADLRQVIAELDELMRTEFRKTFDAVAREFHELFTRLFGGGSARLILNDAESTAEMGIDIEARLPGRRDQGLSLLSGGERSLTATALIFSLLKVSPTPFCVMDEVDAMLDEANVGRFRDLLAELSEKTQFVLVTHNRNTVQAADVIYGVTMGRDSASQVISLRLDELSEEMVK